MNINRAALPSGAVDECTEAQNEVNANVVEEMGVPKTVTPMGTPNGCNGSAIGATSVAKCKVEDGEVFLNIRQNFLVVTEDRMRLVLQEYLPALEQRRIWIAPLGLFVTLGVTFVTADFRDFLFKAATWEAVFVIALCGSLLWLGRSVFRSFKVTTIENVLSAMKNAGKT